MKNKMKYYVISWIVLVALFNVVCFVTPEEINGVSKYDGAFWSGYGFIMATFILHFIYAIFSLSTNSKEKRILNVPLMIISCCELVLMVIAGLVCMVIPGLPNWVGSIVCSIILAFSVLSVITFKGVGENSSNANRVLNERTNKFRELYDVSVLIERNARNEESRQLARKVSEAIKYSDPVSDESLFSMENEIELKLNNLSNLISNEEEMDIVKGKVNELLSLIEARNNKCKTMKRQRI